MSTSYVKNGLVVGVILLFIGVAVQPSIIADVSIESDDSELVEITVQIYEVDKAYNQTVMLTKEQAEELENLINNFEIELKNADDLGETETIFKDTIVSLDELGLLPEGMSVEEAQQLVTGEEQNPRVIRILDRWFSKNQKSLSSYDNILCLISGESINTVFIGPIPLLFGLHCISLYVKYFRFLEWLQDNNPELWSWWSENFSKLGIDLLFLRVFFWIYLGAGLNFLPLKIGGFIYYGWYKFIEDVGIWPIPAEGWVGTTGLSGKKHLSGNLEGYVIGFTGIKIIRDFLDFYYLGAALRVKIKY